MGGTAKKPKPRGKFASLVFHVGKMNKDEFRKSLENVGIITNKGELTKNYRLAKKKPKAKKKAVSA